MTFEQTTTKPEPSGRALLRALESRECSARELVERTIERIERVNPAINAAVAIEPDRSLRAADDADRRRKEGNSAPLLGLPVTIKDSLDVAGWVTTGGSFAREGHRAARDATVVRRLHDAGAIVVAKTNLPECSAAAETDNAIFGRTNNPRRLERTCGGSSGGEAALLAADASIVGIGIDVGCSIRLPSHYCGTVGLRPTVGRVPETGAWPSTRSTGILDMACVGPMTRYVEDLELLLPLIAGADWVDPFAPPIPSPALPVELPSDLRVACYIDDPLTVVTAATAEAVMAAARAIGEPVEVTPPNLSDATDLFFECLTADGGAHIKRAIAEGDNRHTPQFNDFVNNVLPAEPPPASEAFDRLSRLFRMRAVVRAFVAEYDVIVCPVAPGPAPPHGEAPDEGIPGHARGFDWLNFASTFSVGGLPVAVVPSGGDGGLPIGVQIAAGPYREDLALAAAYRVEEALGGFRPGTRQP